jgi:hypothetical protein
VNALRLQKIPERPHRGFALVWMFQKDLIGQKLLPLCPVRFGSRGQDGG